MSNQEEIPARPSRSSLEDIPVRHARDHWKDAIFIIAAVILVAVSIGSVTSKAAGKVTQKQWDVALVPGPDLNR